LYTRSATACKPPAGVGDSPNVSSELAGN
jgi:hypothetical protein